MEKDYSIYIFDIIESIELIESYVDDMSRDDFLNDSRVRDAVVRRVEIIGEAAKRVSDAMRNTYKDVAWRQIAGTRDRLVHDYGDVDFKGIWDIVKNDLPMLKTQMKEIIEKERYE